MVDPTQCPTAVASTWRSDVAWVDCEAPPSPPPLVAAWCDEPSAAVCVVGYEQLLDADRPPSPPPAPLSPPGCANTCPDHPQWISDGECDDGGPDSTYSECAYGTLCAGSNPHPNPLAPALSTRAQTSCPSPSPCPTPQAPTVPTAAPGCRCRRRRPWHLLTAIAPISVPDASPAADKSPGDAGAAHMGWTRRRFATWSSLRAALQRRILHGVPCAGLGSRGLTAKHRCSHRPVLRPCAPKSCA